MTYNNKNTFKTTNKTDYTQMGMTKEAQELFQKKYLEQNSNNLLDKNELDSIYNISMKNPKEQIKKYDYDKIKFKQEKEILDTITQQIKPKDKNCWSFDYFNEEKNKDHKYNPFQIRSINSRLDIRRHHKGYKDNKQIWDPIANRYFQCPIENDIKIEKLRKEM
jgi:aspartate carbamoyltransferase regulatory subunit